MGAETSMPNRSCMLLVNSAIVSLCSDAVGCATVPEAPPAPPPGPVDPPMFGPTFGPRGLESPIDPEQPLATSAAAPSTGAAFVTQDRLTIKPPRVAEQRIAGLEVPPIW